MSREIARLRDIILLRGRRCPCRIFPPSFLLFFFYLPFLRRKIIETSNRRNR